MKVRLSQIARSHVHRDSTNRIENIKMIASKKIYIVNLLMAVLPNSGCQGLKARLYRWAGAKVGRNVEFFQGIKVQGIGELEIGDGAFIGHEVLLMLNEGSKIIIEESAVVSSRAMLITGFHPITPNGERIIGRDGTSSIVRVCKGAAVLVGCNVLPGVTIGEMSLVAAGATVAKNVAPYTLVGGCPAKFIRSLK